MMILSISAYFPRINASIFVLMLLSLLRLDIISFYVGLIVSSFTDLLSFIFVKKGSASILMLRLGYLDRTSFAFDNSLIVVTP